MNFLALFLIALLPGADAWCCRACGKCMCSLYGVCPSPTAAQPPFDLHSLSSQQVAEFIASISPNGSRQWCPAGCTLIELFNATLFLEHGWHGKRLAAFLQEHEARFNAHVVHNATLREAHCQWLASHKVLPSGLKSEQYLALVTRMQGALKSANASFGSSSGDGSTLSKSSSSSGAQGSGSGHNNKDYGELGGTGGGKRRLKLLGSKRTRKERKRA